MECVPLQVAPRLSKHSKRVACLFFPLWTDKCIRTSSYPRQTCLLISMDDDTDSCNINFVCRFCNREAFMNVNDFRNTAFSIIGFLRSTNLNLYMLMNGQ